MNGLDVLLVTGILIVLCYAGRRFQIALYEYREQVEFEQEAEYDKHDGFIW